MLDNVLVKKFVLRFSVLLLIIFGMIMTMDKLMTGMYSLDFPNKKNKWFTLKNHNKIVAELGTKHFDLYLNVQKEKYLSFIVFTQGSICKTIFIEQPMVSYMKFKQLPFLDQSLEIPTLNTDPKEFCKNSSGSHFKLKDMDSVKTVKKSFKRFNTDAEIDHFIKTVNSKKSKKDLKEETVTVDVIEMTVHKI